MLGKLLIILSLIISFSSSILFILNFLKNKKDDKLAFRIYLGAVTGIVISCFYLLILLFSHKYEFTYVWNYSSNDLPFYLLISSFYAGNQGSFLLWLLFSSLIGIVLNYNLKDNLEYKHLTMFSFALIVSFLLLILVFNSPFDYVWETYLNKGIQEGFIPANGKGLNPILQNIWIVIHPPVLFLGYGLLSIPFCIALSALILNDFKYWIKIAYKWLLASAAILGLGIALGGYWAYETLGWGGFWGWDPVENSSLLPWLIIVALLHTANIQIKKESLIKTNFILAIISYSLVIYATFLTRSGILGNTSVHSFIDPGNIVYNFLVIFLLLVSSSGIILFLLKLNKINRIKSNIFVNSYEFYLTLGSISLVLFTAIIFFGTSLPIILEFLGFKKSSVGAEFYNKWSYYFTLILFLANIFAIIINLKDKKVKILKLLVIGSIVFATLISALYYYFTSNYTYLPMILVLSSSFIINLAFLIFNFDLLKYKLGGFISHFGIILLVLGSLFSTSLTSSKSINLKKNEELNVFNYKIKFIEKIEIDKKLQDRQKFTYKLQVSGNNSTDFVYPIVYWSDFNERQSPIIEPAVLRSLSKDLYVVLKGVEVLNSFEAIELTKDSSAIFNLDTNIKITLLNFDLSHKSIRDLRNPSLGAFIKYQIQDKIFFDTLTTPMTNSSVFSDYKWNKIQNSDYSISFTRLIPIKDKISNSIAVFTFKKSNDTRAEPDEILSVEFTNKPFIDFVWIAFILIFFGLIYSLVINILSNYKK